MEADFAEPFASLLDSSIFMLKNEDARTQDGQPNEVTHLAFAALMKKSKTKTSTFFTGAGLSKSTYLHETGLEPPRGKLHENLSCKSRLMLGLTLFVYSILEIFD